MSAVRDFPAGGSRSPHRSPGPLHPTHAGGAPAMTARRLMPAGVGSTSRWPTTAKPGGRHRGGRRRRGPFSRRPGPPTGVCRPFLHRHRTGGRPSSPDPTESWLAVLRRQGGGDEGTGHRSRRLRLTEVEVRRGTGAGATAGAPSLVLHGAAAAPGGPVSSRPVPSLAHPHGHSGGGLRGGPRTVRPVLPVLTADEMRAADAAASPRSVTRPWSAGPGPPWARPPCASSGAATGAGSPWWWARAATAPMAAWPPPFWPDGGRRSADRRRRAPRPGLPRCDLVIDAAYGTGFRGTYDVPAVPDGVPVLSVDIPSGVDADTGAAPGTPFRATRTVTFAAYKPGLLEGAGVDCSGEVQVVDIGVPVSAPRAALIEDADVAAGVPLAPASRTSGAPPSASPRARWAWRGRPSCAPGAPWRQGRE